MSKRYILTYGSKTDVGPGDTLRLIGPFENAATLSEWGCAWQAKHGDDPRWQEVETGPSFLTEVHNGVPVVIIEVEPPTAAV